MVTIMLCRVETNVVNPLLPCCMDHFHVGVIWFFFLPRKVTKASLPVLIAIVL